MRRHPSLRRSASAGATRALNLASSAPTSAIAIPLSIALAITALLAACDYRNPYDPTLPCEALDVRVLERSVSPPANVSALVRVTDCKSKPLGRRLAPAEFELLENGRVLDLYEADRLITPAERDLSERTLIALDLSGSILRSGLRPAMIAGAQKLIDARTENQQIAVFGFDGRAELTPFSYFTSDPDRLRNALQTAEAIGLVDDSTNLNGAVLAALEILNEAVEVDERDIYTVPHGSLVIFTDGEDLAGRAGDDQVALALDATPHASFAIGIGDGIDDTTLARIGRTAKFHVEDVEGISGAFTQVAEQLIQRAEEIYVVSYCSPARAGTRTLEIRAGDGMLSGAASLEFDATGFGAGCSPAGSPLR